MDTFEFAKWKDVAESLGAKRQPVALAARYKAVSFEKIQDRDAFYELCEEFYPKFRFFCGNIDWVPSVQVQGLK